MKNILILITAALLLVSCGGDAKKQSIADIIETGDLNSVSTARDAIAAQRQELNEQLKQLDEKLKELNPETNIPLITAFTTKTERFEHFIEIQGSVETDQNIIVTPEMGGVLTTVYVKEGESVKQGQILAKIDDGGLGQQLAQMQVQADLAKTTFERQERLWNQKIGSEIQYLQAKSNYEASLKSISSMQQQVGKSNVRAPFSGTIDDIITKQGSVVAPGSSPLLRIVSLKNMHIAADIPESYLGSVVKGKAVGVEFPVLNKALDATVSQTGDYINPDNRTFKAEIDVPNADKSIKPNLTARLKINDYTSEEAILIPQSIISENAQGEQYVYILKEKHDEKAVAYRVIIETGKTQGDMIEVLKGVNDGEEIIEEGARSVKDGQTVKLITD